ncbi:MAG: hypothetical protein AAF624_18895 [Bacteroidota bacterium]
MSGASVAWGQQVRVTVAADSVTVGERFEIGLAVEHGRSTRVAFPDLPPLSDTFGADGLVDPAAVFGDAEVLAARRFPPAETASGARLDSVVFLATTFALDAARIGPIPVALVAGTGAAADTVTLDVPTQVLPVRSVVPDSLTAPLQLAPALAFPEPLPLWVALLVGALLLLLGVWLWRTRHRGPGLAAPPLPPHAQARKRLDALRPAELDLTDSEAVPAYYAALSNAVRTYLTRALGVPAQEQTTRELLTALDGHPNVDEATRLRLGVLLRRADLAKFARATPDAATRTTDRTAATESVDEIQTRIAARAQQEAAESEAAKQGDEETAKRGDGEAARPEDPATPPHRDTATPNSDAS